MRILGVDPGSNATGFGIIDIKGNSPVYVASGCIRQSPKKKFSDRLQHIYKELTKLIEKYKPCTLALEDVFVANNVKSALKLGQVRGAVMIAATDSGMAVKEYPPTKVKMALVGYGRAEKSQVAEMVRIVLSIEKPASSDEADALAAAICHCHSAREQEITERKRI